MKHLHLVAAASAFMLSACALAAPKKEPMAPDTVVLENGKQKVTVEDFDAAMTRFPEGLREEASPISRRLAEVKGLSNNAIRRLDGIEQTLAIERDARLDDLTLLVDLLTEGWRALIARLDKIETALEQPGNVVPLRGRICAS